MKLVILFGGTFDPPHLGHLTMAQLALEQTAADELWFLPAPAPPHKPDVMPIEYGVRVAMTEELIRGFSKMRVSTVESSLAKPSYTVDTIKACQLMYPHYRFYFLIGADSLYHLPTWQHAEELTQRVEFLVAARSSYPFAQTLEDVKPKLPDLRVRRIEMPLLDVSSTWLRDRIRTGLPVCGLVPERVLKVMEEQV
ncbi:nicotinate (nicotinamide) nucleotide adenylyltransferase [Alicyclobacillus tolerans]|uniref:nicotinate (nicotinamide) nucleotide adenylyltransferase n=1 Tax=Alicyclobacillus tolerans TaxID=90970 RepID=UPI001EFFF63B|nr:nicotinate (nicotinamide) nucleotide adenylyltransferase [Alicyclobacillus tolerans]MCF8563307.1 nicotinate (nicotinamide) nucleotide adenylyltransferase [Alicyclobacillus tolerans]